MVAKQKNLSASLEDYLEAILNLSDGGDGARSKDIAESLGVSMSSVTGALKLLKKKGLANYSPYGAITLTGTGKRVAEDVVRKHNVLTNFFIRVLGLDSGTAERAACRAEHTLGSDVISRLLAFMEFMTRSGEIGYDVAEEFQRFLEENPSRR